jgi:hypothetical protein
MEEVKQELRRCPMCKCTVICEDNFKKNRKGVWYKTCNVCLEKAKQYRKKNVIKIKTYAKIYRDNNKELIKKHNIRYYQDNVETFKKKRVEYCAANPEKIKLGEKRYRAENKDILKVKHAIYYRANAERCNAQKKTYNDAHPEKAKARGKAYRDRGGRKCDHAVEKQSCKICDPLGHLKKVVTARVHHALKADKNRGSLEYLGCDIDTFRKHIEDQFTEGMSWDNYGDFEIDHIIPVKYKKDGIPPTLEEVAERLHYTNTQPLWKHENMAKGNRYIG